MLSNLNEARNEWCSRLVSILTPRIMEGIRSIFNESWKMSVDNGEVEKYLMTFQNFICRVPKWNATIIDEERNRIVEKSGCNYLEDLITCVHVIQLKVLTCIRVGTRQKKIDISIPKLNDFLHKAYINVARKVYKNAYLFDKNASPLNQQKHGREFEIIVEECILKTIRESIPTEAIVRAYLDESEEFEEEVIVENASTEDADATQENPAVKGNDVGEDLVKDEPPSRDAVPSITNVSDEPVTTRLTFNDIDSAIYDDGREEKIQASKAIPVLEELGTIRALERKMLEEEEDDKPIQIGGDEISLDLGAMDLNPFSLNGSDVLLDDIEEM